MGFLQPFYRGVVLLLFAGTWGCKPSSELQGFAIESCSIRSGEVVRLNQPIEFTFTKSVRHDSIGFTTITILPLSDDFPDSPIPGSVQGFFYLKAGTDDRVLVFQPACPTNAELNDGGLLPGTALDPVYYQISFACCNQGVRSQDGAFLENAYGLVLQTVTLPGSPFLDPKPLNPPAVLHSEIPNPLGLNLFSAPISPFVVTVDQPLLATTVDNASVRIEFTDSASSMPFSIPCSIALLNNCTPEQTAQLLVIPQGILPASQELRFYLSKNLSGLGDFDFNVEDILFKTVTTSDAASPSWDEYVEEFDSSTLADTAAPLLWPLAQIVNGTLQSPPSFPSQPNGIEIEIGPFTTNGSNAYYSTDGSTLYDTQGQPHFFADGLIEVDRFTIKSPLLPGQNSSLTILGSKPLVIRTIFGFTIDENATLSADGQSAPDVTGIHLANYPAPGGEGNAGGGAGGIGSPSTTQSDPKGGDGRGWLNTPGLGGLGGHSAFGSTNPYDTRPGGGGGGNWGIVESFNGAIVTFCYGGEICTDCASCAPPCAGYVPITNSHGENGNTGVNNSIDAIFASSPAMGGLKSAPVFADSNPNNNFLGKKPNGSGIIAGELLQLQGGPGGGAGGDNVPSPLFPSGSNFWYDDKKGAGGGGGGGAIRIQSDGPIVIRGKIHANGGDGGAGEEMDFAHLAGGGGGGGAGGMLDIESNDHVLIGFNAAIHLRGGDRGPGSGNAAGTNGSSNNCKKKNNTAARGGAGGKGLVQIHVPFDEASGADCNGDGLLEPRVESGKLLIEVDSSGMLQPVLCERETALTSHFDPDPNLLIPTFGPRSAIQSKWIYFGQVGPQFEDPLIETDGENATLLFEGAEETTPGSAAPESTSLTGLTSTLQILNGKNLLRFRITLNSSNSAAPAAISSLRLPFSF